MKYFVDKGSIVREIWGKADTILFIFGGAAAEFALNKAVDWLYFTGKLPADPLGRLFSTVSYARQIVFAGETEAFRAIDKITSIHAAVESSRAAKIPEWAYRDVLFMLIWYSMSAYELLERKMLASEKDDLFQVFYRMGLRMGLKDLPENYVEWLRSRKYHLDHDLAKSTYTVDLFKQYKKHLGPVRYGLLVEAQKLVVPPEVFRLLGFRKLSYIKPVLVIYKFTRYFKLDWLLKSAILPAAYHKQIRDLDVKTN